MAYSKLWDANGLTETGKLVLSDWKDSGASLSHNAGSPNLNSMVVNARIPILGDLIGAGLSSTILSIPKSLYTVYGQGSNGGSFGYMWGDGWLTLTNLSDVILQDFRVDCTAERYDGHKNEKGFNGLILKNCTNVLIQWLHFHNTDTAIFLKGCSHITVRDILCTSSRAAWGEWKGHYRVSLDNSHHCLIGPLDDSSIVYHTVSLQGSSYNVIRRIGGLKVTLDHHRDAQGDLSHHNLFTDCDVDNVFAVAGNSTNPLSIGDRETYWNVRRNGAVMSSKPTWSKLVVVPYATDNLSTTGQWTEQVSGLTPTDLYLAQVGGTPPPPPPPDPKETAKDKLRSMGFTEEELGVIINA